MPAVCVLDRVRTEAPAPHKGIPRGLPARGADYSLPVELVVEPNKLVVSGSLTIVHSDFGLQPFSAAGGLLRVADQIDMDFEFVARR